MALHKQIAQYQNDAIFTATPEELTLMLYNGLIKFIKQAKMATEDKVFDKANESCIKAQKIIRELMNTLDMKYEISNNLMLLYDYFYNRLVEANIKKNPEIYIEVEKSIEDLRDTWIEAIKLARIQQGKIDKSKSNNEG